MEVVEINVDVESKRSNNGQRGFDCLIFNICCRPFSSSGIHVEKENPCIFPFSFMQTKHVHDHTTAHCTRKSFEHLYFTLISQCEQIFM